MNPFAEDADPFSDPSVRTASKATSRVPEYNPFQDPGYHNNFNAGAQQIPDRQGAERPTTQAPSSSLEFLPPSSVGRSSNDVPSGKIDGSRQSAPSLSASAPFAARPAAPAGALSGKTPVTSPSASFDDEAMKQREEELRRKEDELRARENELNQRAAQLAAQGPLKNWPHPRLAILYHSIKNDIQPQHKVLVTQAYFLWFFLVWSLIMNWLTTCVIWFGTDTTNSSTGGASFFFWAAIYMLTGIPGAWIFWYKALYNSCKIGSTRSLVWFFIHMFFHVVFSGMMFSGFFSGASGLLTFLDMMNRGNHTAMVFAVISMCNWIVVLVCSVYITKKAQFIYRFSGMMQRDQQTARMAQQFASTYGQTIMTTAAHYPQQQQQQQAPQSGPQSSSYRPLEP